MSKHLRTKKLLIGIVSTLLGTVGGAITVAYFVVNRLTRPAIPSVIDSYFFSPFEFGVPYETVEFPAAHGAHLVQGWFLPREGTRRVIVLCPGYRRHRSDMLGIAVHLWRAGAQVLLFDFHGHGHAWGQPVTLGFREVYDLLGALDYAQQRVPGAILGVMGYSMGAAVSIMGVARRPEVRALISDSAFARHWDTVSFGFKRIARLPATPFIFLADWMMGWRAGYRFHQVEPLRYVGRIAPRPLLLIHGLEDQTTSAVEAVRLYEAANQPKELWLVEGAGHCGAYFQDRAFYFRRITDFFETHLGAAEAETDQSALRPMTLEESAFSQQNHH